MIEPQDTLHFLDYWRVIRSRKEIVMAVSLLVILAGIVITYALPKVYMASCVVAVREETPDVAVFSKDLMRYDPFFLRTQFEIIQSRPVLEEVIARLNLEEKLGKAYGYANQPNRVETTFKILSKRMKVQQYRDTNLIQIRIYLSEPKETAWQEAADTANMVASVFRDQRMKVTRDETERALRALHESLEEQKLRVGEQEQKVEDIRQKYKINLVSSAAGTDSALGKRSLAQLEDYRLKASLDLSDRKVRLDHISNLPPGDLVDAAPYVGGGDAALSALVAEKRHSEVELSRLQGAYGTNHPEVVRAKAVISELDAKVHDAVNGLKKGVQADYDAAKAKFEILQRELDAMKATEISAEAGGYREFSQAVQELDHARKIRDALEMRYLQERIEMRIPRTTVQVVEQAEPPGRDEWVSPKSLLNIVLSVMVGLISGIGMAFFIEYMDTSIKTIDDIERYIGSPVLGVIPQKVKPLNEKDAEWAHAEAYRVLRTNLKFSKKFGDGKTLSVTSGSVGEGKSLTLFNLGFICAQLGDRVLIVDADLHRPKQHKLLNMSNSVGLVDVLVANRDVGEAIVPTAIEHLDLLPSGKAKAGVHGLLDTRRMKELVGELRERYDLVLFDSPPIIGVSDASLIAREMDSVLLVIQHRKYPQVVSSRARDMVESLGANLVGVVLNNINISKDYSYYYHQYYSSYYTKPPVGDQTQGKA